jgi:biotin synthase
MPLSQNLLNQASFSKNDIVRLLGLDKTEGSLLLQKSREVADKAIGKKVYFRGLIEYSNICTKNCYYCGIRKGNKEQLRYTMKDEEVLECARFAYEKNYGSIVIQTGERSDKSFVDKIEYLLKEIKKLSNDKLGITLSLGEQSFDTYQRWFEAGGHRYLLRIETSDKSLYKRFHPSDNNHNFEKRLESLELIRKAGFQLGTGIMIGLPGQTNEDLAEDLLFIRQLDVDMVGMGPYIEHEQTPMYNETDTRLSKLDRYELSLKMLAILRLMMPNINMAATTAMQAIHPQGREQAILAGANIVMPNLTPLKYRECYMLYDGKPCLDEEPIMCSGCLIKRINLTGCTVGLGEWGDSQHFLNKQKGL